MDNLPDKIDVLNLGGVVKGKYKTTDQTDRGERLTGPTFISKCPIPDIQPNTMVVAVCGITDWADEASPQKSGWFFSDFYLFHHLLKEVSRDQIWLTSVSPEYAVQKYGEYLHGDSDPGAMSARRVVLDKAMLSEVSDIRTVRPRDLRERFLSSLLDVCTKSREQDRPVLVLIFGHGIAGSFNIVLGGEGDPDKRPKNSELTMDLFKIAISTRRPTKNLCLLTTACFGGGWAINPELNITTMAGAGPNLETLSWPISGTANMRACGSPYVGAIADCLKRLTIEDWDDDPEPNPQTPSYAGFIHLITDAVQKADPRMVTGQGGRYSLQQPMFSAENDDWAMSYSERTGLPLNRFQERWMKLRAPRPSSGAPPGGPSSGSGSGSGASPGGPSSSSGSGSGASSGGPSSGSGSTSRERLEPGGRLYSHSEIYELVKYAGMAYRKSYPGIDSKAKNIGLHGKLMSLLDRGNSFSTVQLTSLLRELDYRLIQITCTATIYKNFLGADDMPDCHEWVLDNLVGTSTPWRPNPVAQGSTLLKDEVFRLVYQYPLFDKPPTGCWEFNKGNCYIVACIMAVAPSMEEAVAKLESLVDFKSKF